MARGRPKGSKNKSSHNAGGDRRSASFKGTSSSTQAGPLDAAFAASSKTSNNENAADHSPLPPPAAAAAAKFEQQQLSVEKLRQVLQHPSNNYGGKEYVILEDDGFDYNNDDDSDAGCYKRAYVPPKGSALQEYLETFQTRLSKNNLDGFKKGRHWYPPTHDPVSVKMTQPVPYRWYTGNCWVYAWIPEEQYPHLVHNTECIFCSKSEKIESNGLHWRPMYFWNRLVWVLHRRYKCTHLSCKRNGKCRTFAGIDPRALSGLPTRISERFEFVTTPSGPGMHRTMLYSFASLLMIQVSFGPFVKMVNEMQGVDYWYEQISYYDALAEWTPSVLGYNGKTEITPFSAMMKPGEFNGLELTPYLFKALFIRFMEIHEPYMQARYQMDLDEGAAGDDTHKYANKIFVNTAGKTRCQPFGASATVLNRNGKIAISRLKYTKSHQEMRPILESWADVRRNSGAQRLAKYSTDNVEGDQSLWSSIFPELLEGVVPYNPNPNLPCMTIDEDGYRFFTTAQAADNYLLSILDDIKALPDPCYVGLDVENNRNSDITSLLQLSFPGLPVIVLHLYKMGDFPTQWKRLLQTETKLHACGRNIGYDLSRLEEIGITIQNRVELRQLALSHIRRVVILGFLAWHSLHQ